MRLLLAATMIAIAIVGAAAWSVRGAPYRLVANGAGSFWRLNAVSGAVELCSGQVANDKLLFLCIPVRERALP